MKERSIISKDPGLSAEVNDVLLRLEAGETVFVDDFSLSLSYCNMCGINFIGSKIAMLSFAYSTVTACDFRGDIVFGGNGVSDFYQVNFDGVSLYKGEFAFCKMKDVSFVGANLCKSLFYNVYFTNVSFDDANLNSASFVKCDLRTTSFEGAAFDQTSFSDCRLPEYLIGHPGVRIKDNSG